MDQFVLMEKGSVEVPLVTKNPSRSTSKVSVVTENSKFVHIKECLIFFIFKVGLLSLDVATDIGTANEHFSFGHTFWGCLTVVPILAPTLAKFILFVINLGKIRRSENTKKKLRDEIRRHQELWEIIWQLPILQTFRNFGIFIALCLMDTNLHLNHPLLKKLKSKAIDSGLFEAFLESAPQLILQIYIIIQSGEINAMQCFGLPVSFLSLSYTSTMMFFFQRRGRYQDLEPPWKARLLIYPFISLQLLGPLFSLVVGAIYFKLFLFACILVIISFNFCLCRIFSRRFVRNAENLEDLFVTSTAEGKSTVLNRAAFTSWISTCSVFENNSFTRVFTEPNPSLLKNKFLILISLTSQSFHMLMISVVFVFVSQVDLFRMGLNPITHCMSLAQLNEYNLTSDSLENVKYLFTSLTVVRVQEQTIFYSKEVFIRMCAENELPNDFFKSYIATFAYISIVISFLASICLQILGNYQQLYEWSKVICCKKPIVHQYLLQDLVTDITYVSTHEFKIWIYNNIVETLKCDASNLNKPDSLRGNTCLHTIVAIANDSGTTSFDSERYEKMLKLLLQNGGDVYMPNNMGQTPYSQMSTHQKIICNRISQTLEESRTNYSHTSMSQVWQNPPMHKMFQEKNYKSFIVLNLIGGNLSAKDSHGNDLYSFVVNPDNHEILSSHEKLFDFWFTMMSAEEQTNLLFRSIRAKNVELVRKLTKLGINVNCIEQESLCLPLHETISLTLKSEMCQEVGIAIIESLIENGASIDKLDKDCLTPLQIAVQGNLISAIEVLICRGKANVNSKSFNGRSPLHAAAEKGHLESLNLLLENGAEPETKDDSGITPLHIAAKMGHVNCASLLLEKNPKIDSQSNDGQTPLHFAASSNQPECVQLLLSFNAKVNIADNNNKIPLHCAAIKGNLDCLKMLLDHGSKMEAQDDKGRTVVHCAAEYDYYDCLEHILRKAKEIENENLDRKIVRITSIKDSKGRTALDVADVNGTCAKLLRMHEETN